MNNFENSIKCNGIVLIGNDNKDIIMKVSFDGKIIYRTNGNVKFKSVTNAETQVNNGKMVVCNDDQEGKNI